MPAQPSLDILHLMDAQNSLRLDQPALYRVCLQGHVTAKWDDWLQNTVVTFEDRQTTLKGEVRDQAALFGLLSFVRNLGVVLIVVELIQPL
jgi:hypothetical protein